MIRPKEITTYRLLEVCDLVAGSRGKRSDTGYIPIYGAGVSPTGMSQEANCPAGSIRMTRKGTVGNIYHHEEAFWAEDACYIVEPKPMIDKMYLFHWLLMKQSEIQSFKDGTIIPSLSLHRLGMMEIEVPDMEYQKKAVIVLDDLVERSGWFIASIPTEIDLTEKKSEWYFQDFLDKITDTKQEEET